MADTARAREGRERQRLGPCSRVLLSSADTGVHGVHKTTDLPPWSPVSFPPLLPLLVPFGKLEISEVAEVSPKASKE